MNPPHRSARNDAPRTGVVPPDAARAYRRHARPPSLSAGLAWAGAALAGAGMLVSPDAARAQIPPPVLVADALGAAPGLPGGGDTAAVAPHVLAPLASLAGLSGHARELPLRALRGNLNAGMLPGAPTAQAGGPVALSALPSSAARPAWVELLGSWQRTKGASGAGTLRQHTGGVFAGADTDAGHGWRWGGAWGYTDTRVRVDSRDSRATISSHSATLYGGKEVVLDNLRLLNVSVGAAYTRHDIDSTRQLPGLGQTLKARYRAHAAQVFGELGYVLGQVDARYVEPFVGLAVHRLETRGFAETGGSAALQGNGASDTQTSTTLGLRTQTAFKLGQANARIRGTLGWRHTFGDIAMARTLALRDGSQAFNASGTPLARHAALLGLEARIDLSAKAALVLGIRGVYGDGARDTSASLKVSWAF